MRKVLSNRYKLYNGDCLRQITKVKSHSISLILTDPPYNIAQFSTGNINWKCKRKELNNNIAKWDEKELKPELFVDNFVRILKPDGNIVVFTNYNLFGKWYDAFQPYFRSNIFIWHKTNPAPKIYKSGFLNSCELVLLFYNKGHKFKFTTQGKMHNFFESSVCMRPERLSNPVHPAQKPVKLLEHFVKIMSDENDIVYDPFMGVGSTGVACMNNFRRFIGCELDEKYFNASVERIKLAKGIFI